MSVRQRQIGFRTHLDQPRRGPLELVRLIALGREIQRQRIGVRRRHQLHGVVIQRVDQRDEPLGGIALGIVHHRNAVDHDGVIVVRKPQVVRCGEQLFADICEKLLAASDYLRLAHDYHTILIDRIPVMDYAERNAAKRFIALIDTLYDNVVKLMASAAADPVSLYLATEGPEANEFKRTASRLIEMSSESY